MRRQNRLAQKFLRVGAILALAFAAASPAASAQAYAYKVIHDFTGADGEYPWYDLIFDASGNLYGTTALGDDYSANCGQDGCGTVFKLSKMPGGEWQRSVLHVFTGDPDGWEPGSLVFDASGNLYGTTFYGGLYNGGIAFELSPTLTGPWAETVLYNFGAPGDAFKPWSGLIFDSAGNLYGTSSSGGASGYGSVFELSPVPTGGWSEALLYSFTGSSDGATPYTGVTFDSAGNLYGTTGAGGSSAIHLCKINGGCGVVFELSPNPSGPWTETVLHTFNGLDGWHSANLIFDSSGNLYSSTGNGGNLSGCGGFGCGVVYELSPNADAGWTETVLHVFTPGSGYGGAGGSTPVGVTFDSAGNLYGTTFYGGIYSDCSLGLGGCGVVFKLSRSSTGTWEETVLHYFSGGADGGSPQSGVTFGPNGNLFSTGVSGPPASSCNLPGGCGVVFEIVP
jgi:uncharacterized repeat protein (TIGR03803 family)